MLESPCGPLVVHKVPKMRKGLEKKKEKKNLLSLPRLFPLLICSRPFVPLAPFAGMGSYSLISLEQELSICLSISNSQNSTLSYLLGNTSATKATLRTLAVSTHSTACPGTSCLAQFFPPP
jgi:hypothetical protein